MEETSNSCILTDETISGNDYLLGGDSDLSVKLKNLIQNPNKSKVRFNQYTNPRTRMWCTHFSAWEMLGDNTGRYPTMEEILEVGELAIKNGDLGSQGGYLYKAIDYVRNYYNKKFPNNRVVSFRVFLNTDEFDEVISKGYTVQIGHYTHTDWTKDSQTDGVLNGSEFGKNGGHAVTIYNDGTLKIGDNYEGLKPFNKYGIEHKTELVQKGNIYTSGYLFLKQNNMVFSDIGENHPFYEAFKNAKDSGAIKGYSDGTAKPNQTMTRGEVVELLNRLGLFTK